MVPSGVGDGHAVRLGDGMGQGDEVDPERPDLDSCRTAATSVIENLVEEPLLAQLLAHQEGGERPWRRTRRP